MMAQLWSLACDADVSVLTCAGGCNQPARLLQEPALATSSEIKAQEKTLLLHTRLQYILSALLADRPNDTFHFRTAK